MIKTYTMLTKPGIILGNVLTTIAGFAVASKGHFDFFLFFVTLLGLSCIIASAGIFNNYIDKEADAKMQRTKNRALVIGAISAQNALSFASILVITGASLLAFYTNAITVWVALSGFFVYLVLYAFFKYKTYYGTIVGSIAGAVPPVVGYCAVSNRLDIAAFLLFMILVLWQMPHFYAIALYRFEDYKSASIPVLPITKGIFQTKIHMLLYIIAFTFSALTLFLEGYAGKMYFATTTLLGLAWLGLCLSGFKRKDNQAWGQQMFRFSLVVITVLCVMVTVDANNT